MKIQTILLACFGLAFINCATIFTGTQDTVTITSNPEGASVYIGGLKMSSSGNYLVKKGFDTQNVTLKKDGYQDTNFILQRSFNAVSILNIFFPLGFVVDAVTGAMMKHDPTVYVIEMDKKKQS